MDTINGLTPEFYAKMVAVSSGHYMPKVTRADGMMRMECSCGQRSRWSATVRPVMAAQERHAARR